MKVGITVGIVVAILALVICFVPLKEVANHRTEAVGYQTQSYVKEGYFDSRFTLGSVAFSKDIGEIEAALQEAYGTPEYYPIGCVVVENTDEVQGTFEIEIAFYSGDEQYADVFTLDLEPGQMEEVSMSAPIHYEKDEWSWKYEVTPSTKQVTYYKTVPLLDYWLHY